MNRMESLRKSTAFLLGLIFVAGCYVALCGLLNLSLLEHSPYDSYTLQAMTWRGGHVALAHDYPWLEIAKYNGHLFISFPPFPSVPMLLLSFAFGDDTPSRLVSMAMVLFAYGMGYYIARRGGARPGWAAFMAAFLVLGCNLAEYGLYGGVWNVAQAMAFALTAAAFAGAVSGRKAGMFFSLVAIACAVGCRPFQAVYAPPLLAMIYLDLHKTRAAKRALLAMLPMLAVPALIAAAYGAYNYVRFGNPLEFGHTYLPEFMKQSQYGQFSVHYMAENFNNILRLPYIKNGHLSFPTASGFAFWLCNPLFLLYGGYVLWRAVRREMQPVDWLLLVCVIVHFALMLTHKSFGGVQFGTRYLCDLVPAMYCFWAYKQGGRRIERGVAALVMTWAVAFNLYGAWWFHQLVG